jgi:hypothetical protein
MPRKLKKDLALTLPTDDAQEIVDVPVSSSELDSPMKAPIKKIKKPIISLDLPSSDEE